MTTTTATACIVCGDSIPALSDDAGFTPAMCSPCEWVADHDLPEA